MIENFVVAVIIFMTGVQVGQLVAIVGLIRLLKTMHIQENNVDLYGGNRPILPQKGSRLSSGSILGDIGDSNFEKHRTLLTFKW